MHSLLSGSFYSVANSLFSYSSSIEVVKWLQNHAFASHCMVPFSPLLRPSKRASEHASAFGKSIRRSLALSPSPLLAYKTSPFGSLPPFRRFPDPNFVNPLTALSPLLSPLLLLFTVVITFLLCPDHRRRRGRGRPPNDILNRQRPN